MLDKLLEKFPSAMPWNNNRNSNRGIHEAGSIATAGPLRRNVCLLGSMILFQLKSKSALRMDVRINSSKPGLQ